MNGFWRTFWNFAGERRLPYKRALLVLVAAVVGGLVATVFTPPSPPLYRATAQLYVAPASSPTGPAQDVYLGQTLAKTYSQLATADVVLLPAMQQVGLDQLVAFRARTDVSPARSQATKELSPLINVTFRDEDPQRAADAANAIAESLIAETRGLETALQGGAVAKLDEQITSVQTDIRTLDGQITSLRSDNAAKPSADLQSQILQLDASRQSKQQTFAQLLKTRDDMRLALARARDTVYRWQPATTPAGPEPERSGLIGSLTGAAGAGAVALAVLLAIAYFDDRIRDVDQLLTKLKLVSMAEVFRAGAPDSLAGKLFLRDDPNSLESEAFRSLRMNIVFANVDPRPRRILVTSAVPLEGKSVVSANLALAFAQSGTQTVLIDADLRRPSQHKLFHLSATTGLTSLLTHEGPLGPAVQRFRITEHLIVIPSGPVPANPAELLSSRRMGALINELTQLSDGCTVVVDTSPVLAAPDAVALSTMVDGSIFVIDSGRTHARACRRAIDALDRVRASILGAVLNNVSREQAAYGLEYYGEASSRPTAS